MQRSPCNKTTLGGGQARYTVKYESDPCEPGTMQARAVQIALLRTIGETPDLQLCGLIPFQKMSIRHTGECWLVELEATGSE